jgi:hypothetical protein
MYCSHRQKTRVHWQLRRHAPPLQAGAGRAAHTWLRLTFKLWSPKLTQHPSLAPAWQCPWHSRVPRPASRCGHSVYMYCSRRRNPRVQLRRHAPPLQAGAGRAAHTWLRLTLWSPPPLTSLAVPMAQPRTQTRISLRPQRVHVLHPQAENASPAPAACTSTAGGSRSCRTLPCHCGGMRWLRLTLWSPHSPQPITPHFSMDFVHRSFTRVRVSNSEGFGVLSRR